MRTVNHTKIRYWDWALFLVLLIALVVFWVTYQASAAPAKAPASATTTITVPAFCLNPTATHRTYPLNLPAADQYARSGEHGHGRLTCIVFMTKTYSKTLVLDQGTGGYLIGPAGLDVTYVDCGLPGYRFPPPPFTGTNDCAEAWGSGEGHWVFVSGPDTGAPMFPAATP